ncbi:MAG: cupredoxin domain-containing protein [Chloroflexota bacterium]
MTAEDLEGRRARREAAREVARQVPKTHAITPGDRGQRVRQGIFGLIVVAALVAGGYLAFGDLAGQRSAASSTDAIPVRLSMAGFTPADIQVPAGKAVAIELWTTDAAPHLQDGVHTMISDELGIYEQLPAAGPTGESRKVVTIQAPAKPGVYDIYCDTCCGGRDSPTMHGTITVTA